MNSEIIQSPPNLRFEACRCQGGPKSTHPPRPGAIFGFMRFVVLRSRVSVSGYPPVDQPFVGHRDLLQKQQDSSGQDMSSLAPCLGRRPIRLRLRLRLSFDMDTVGPGRRNSPKEACHRCCTARPGGQAKTSGHFYQDFLAVQQCRPNCRRPAPAL